MSHARCALLVVLPMALVACSKAPPESEGTPDVVQPMLEHSYPPKAEVQVAPLLDHKGVTVFNGGYGSDLAVDPSGADQFYLLTDRGPNCDATTDDHVTFLQPSFQPSIGRFKLEGDKLTLIESIGLEDEQGRPLTGLPHAKGQGGTGEVPETPDGSVLPYDPAGVDSEGLVAASDGTFWISDEYGPSILQVDASGRTLRRIDPYGPAGQALPQVFKQRRSNRGMEGLTISNDGRTLIGIMESSLDNPGKKVRDTSVTVRILTYAIATGETHQYLYLQEEPGIGCTALANNGDDILVIERDKRKPGDADKPSKVKRVYRFSLQDATDVSDPNDGPNGLLVDGKTLEQLDAKELAAANITPVTKVLVTDLLSLAAGYPHDKPEGLALLPGPYLAISNDDDFGVDDDGKGGIVEKRLPAGGGAVDRCNIYFLKL